MEAHKTQALSITHIVRGCLEGIFAQGQIYVLVSRVTDPSHFQLVGLPPADLLQDIYAAWVKAGLDPIECLRRCVTVTNEWIYTPGPQDLRDRFSPRFVKERTVPLKHRELHEMLNPQPRAAAVIHRLLDWIDRVDMASQSKDPEVPKPLFATKPSDRFPCGEPIFPDDEDPWWLTDVQRKPTTEPAPPAQEEEAIDEVDELMHKVMPEPPTDEAAKPNAKN